jgi:uncharacterized membrane protein
MSADGNTIIVNGRTGTGMTPVVYRFTSGAWDTGTNLAVKSITLFGWSTAMSADGNTVVVNGQANTGMTPVVYRFTGGAWDTGTNLTAKSITGFGYSTAMSADGNTIIVNGSTLNMTPVVYRFTGGAWDTGTNLAAKSITGFGYSTAMSADGNTIIVNGYGNTGMTPIIYKVVPTISISDTSYTYTGLLPVTQYTFTVTPSNVFGNGPSTSSDPISTLAV